MKQSKQYIPPTDELSEKIRTWCNKNLCAGFPYNLEDHKEYKPVIEGCHYIITEKHSIMDGPGNNYNGSNVFYIHPDCTDFSDYITFAETTHFESVKALKYLKPEQLPIRPYTITIEPSIEIIPSCELTMHHFGLPLGRDNSQLKNIEPIILNFTRRVFTYDYRDYNIIYLQKSSITTEDIKNISVNGIVDCLNIYGTPAADEINRWINKHKIDVKTYNNFRSDADITNGEYLDEIFKGFDPKRTRTIKIGNNDKTQTNIWKTGKTWHWQRYYARYILY